MAKGENDVTIKTWVIPILITVLGGGLTFASTQAVNGEKITRLERQNHEDAEINKIVIQHQAILPGIQRSVEKLEVQQTALIEKIDRKSEEDQRVFRQILAAVKQ